MEVPKKPREVAAKIVASLPAGSKKFVPSRFSKSLADDDLDEAQAELKQLVGEEQYTEKADVEHVAVKAKTSSQPVSTADAEAAAYVVVEDVLDAATEKATVEAEALPAPAQLVPSAGAEAEEGAEEGTMAPVGVEDVKPTAPTAEEAAAAVEDAASSALNPPAVESEVPTDTDKTDSADPALSSTLPAPEEDAK